MNNIFSMYYSRTGQLHIEVGGAEFILECGQYDVVTGSEEEVNGKDGLIISKMLPDRNYVGIIRIKYVETAFEDAVEYMRI